MELEFHEIFFIKLEIKNDTANLKAILSKNSHFWNLNYTANLSLKNVVDC